jgi:hypothetical protein
MSQETKSEDESSKLADTPETQPSNNQNLIDPSSNVSDNANVDKSKADTASDLEQDKSKVIENENSAMDTIQINDDVEVSFIGGGNRSTWKKPLTCCKCF